MLTKLKACSTSLRRVQMRKKENVLIQHARIDIVIEIANQIMREHRPANRNSQGISSDKWNKSVKNYYGFL